MKRCNKCLIEKAFSEYNPDLRNSDGLQGRCNQCRKEDKRIQRQKRIFAGSLVTVTTKTCNKCNVTKDAVDFFKDAGIADGLGTICKECKQASTYKWREAKRQEYNEYMKTYRKTHPKKYALERNRNLKHRYGIDSVQYNALLLSQEGKCRICSVIPNNRPLVVDHNHDTKEVRGLLCDGCNVAVAIFDNPSLLQATKQYLKIS